MGAGRGMWRGHLGLDLRVGFLRPLPEDVLPELPQLFDDPLLGGVRGAAVRDGVIKGVEDVVQAHAQLRSLGQTDFETAARGRPIDRGFIIHEPLC